MGQGRRTPGVPAAPLRVLFQSEQVAETEDARAGRSISAGSGRGCAVRPRDWAGTGPARLGARGGRGTDGAGCARGGGLETSGRAGGPQPGPTSGLRRGAPRGRCGPGRGAGPASPRRREGPPGSLGSPLWFPSCLPGPHRPAGVGAGAGGGERHSEFPATLPAGGTGAAARRSQHGGHEGFKSRARPAAATEPAARRRSDLRTGWDSAPHAAGPRAPRRGPRCLPSHLGERLGPGVSARPGAAHTRAGPAGEAGRTQRSARRGAPLKRMRAAPWGGHGVTGSWCSHTPRLF